MPDEEAQQGCRERAASAEDRNPFLGTTIVYESTRGDKVHLFTNCDGLSSVPAEQILLGHRCVCAADPQGSDFLWKQFEAREGRGTRRDEVPRPRAWVPLHARTRHILPQSVSALSQRASKQQARQCAA